MPKTLDPDDVAVEIARQVRRMGARDYLTGSPDCPFGERSPAAKHWREGHTEAARFPLLLLMEVTHDRTTNLI